VLKVPPLSRKGEVEKQCCTEQITDVDDAVAASADPTGGRGTNGTISRQLDNGIKINDKILESAV
jgi:hypothetical protein